MAIKRAKRDTNFTMMSNVGLRDKRLSFKAKGLLAYMLSLPDDWVFYEEEITKHSTDGKQSVRTGLVALLVSAWIEIGSFRYANMLGAVALLVSAWIEI